MTERRTAEVAVIGAGPAGLTAAVALAEAGVATVLVGHTQTDNRTTALLASSVAALETLGVWALCRSEAEPLADLRIVDVTRRLWRAPEVRFAAREIGLEAFGWNIENRHLVAALAARAAELPRLTWIEEHAREIDTGDGVTIVLASGDTVAAHLAVGADGRRSLTRTAAGITTEGASYPQTALTFNVAHSRPHGNISTEFHTEHGPFTLVPLTGNRSSIVCVTAPEDARHLANLDGHALDEELERRSFSIVGKMTAEPGHGLFPLAIETATCFATRRVALVGEAAHTLPPIGAQGLNLGLRDAATIAELAAAALRRGADVGGDDVTAQYDRLRRTDIAPRRIVVDMLNRSLLSDFLPVQGWRGLGLHLLGTVGPLRRAVMREGVTPAMSAPRLMRGEAI